MEFKGTKGKWVVYETIRNNQPVLDIEAPDANEVGVITVWSGLSVGDEIDEVTRANALLISKAPELLEILKLVNDSLLNDPSTIEQIDLRQKVEALIIEATNF